MTNETRETIDLELLENLTAITERTNVLAKKQIAALHRASRDLGEVMMQAHNNDNVNYTFPDDLVADCNKLFRQLNNEEDVTNLAETLELITIVTSDLIAMKNRVWDAMGQAYEDYLDYMDYKQQVIMREGL
jgi:hypothetical protein